MYRIISVGLAVALLAAMIVLWSSTGGTSLYIT